jgi:hypothetical protein
MLAEVIVVEQKSGDKLFDFTLHIQRVTATLNCPRACIGKK